MAVYLVAYLPGSTVPTRVKCVTDATVAPDADDDAATLGVAVGSLWVDTTAQKVWACIDASEGAAVWKDLTGTGGAGGAPTDADYLVTAAHGDLSAEVVVGATPGGELGGTWSSPTVDATHSGSSHAGIQAAAESTAAGYVTAHADDASDAHDASAISVLDTAGHFAGGDVEAVLAELATAAPGGPMAAEDVGYDNTDSGLTATDVQAAIDELATVGPPPAAVWMPLTSVSAGEPVLVWDDDDSLIPTLVSAA